LRLLNQEQLLVLRETKEVNKFNYWTKSRDGKMSGLVNADYISSAMLGRSIRSIGYGTDKTFFTLNLSDGSSVRFWIEPEAPEVHYFSPWNK